jgi:hypothetical protein
MRSASLPRARSETSPSCQLSAHDSTTRLASSPLESDAVASGAVLRRKASTRSRDARTDSSRDVVGEHRHDVDRLQVGHKPDPLERRHVEVLLAVPEVVDVAVDVV